MNENNQATLSFDRMRSMLMRAAEIRDSEQQQIFDTLDEMHARMAPLESLGSMRKRLSELPDRTEVSVLAERMDEAVSKLDAQDGAIAALTRTVEGIVDKLAKPLAELDGRLDNVSGQIDTVAARTEGVEDRLANVHKRLDDLSVQLDGQDNRLDSMPGEVNSAIRERIEEVETGLRSRFAEFDEGVHEHIDGTKETLQRSVTESAESVQSAITDGREQLHGQIDELSNRPTIDPSERLDALDTRLEQLNTRLDEVSARLDSVDSTVTARPDSDSLISMVRRENEESERRNAGQLDEAMATFAELILGGSAQTAAPPPRTVPQQQRNRPRAKSAKRNGSKAAVTADEEDDESV